MGTKILGELAISKMPVAVFQMTWQNILEDHNLNWITLFADLCCILLLIRSREQQSWNQHWMTPNPTMASCVPVPTNGTVLWIFFCGNLNTSEKLRVPLATASLASSTAIWTSMIKSSCKSKEYAVLQSYTVIILTKNEVTKTASTSLDRWIVNP